MAEEKSSPLTQRYMQHNVHETLSDLIEQTGAGKPDNFTELEEAARETYERLLFVLRDLKSRLDNLDPFVAEPECLDQINDQLSQVDSQWSNYLSDPDGQYAELNDQIDTLLSEINKLPAVQSSSDAWESRLRELSKDMNVTIDMSQSKVKNLNATVDDISNNIDDVENKLTSLESEIDTQKSRLDAMLNQQTQVFNESEQDRLSRFNDAQDLRKEDFETQVKEFETAWKELLEAHEAEFKSIEQSGKDKSKSILASIEEQLGKAVEIVGTIVKTSMSGAYQLTARREFWNAWGMRIAAIVSFVGMGLMVVWAVSSLDFIGNEIEWKTFLVRLSLGFAFLLPGLYCANESTRHWKSERKNRKLALELATFDPFLVKLDDAKKVAIIEKKADEYFGNGTQQDEPDELLKLKSVHFRGDQLMKILEQLVKMAKS